MTTEYDPGYVWLHHERLLQLVERLRREPIEDFKYLTAGELNDAIVALREEIERQTVLALVAAFEAVLQRDYKRRLKEKLGTAEDRAIRRRIASVTKRAERVELEAHLLNKVWKSVATHASLDAFKKLLRHRHWLAHGRYWTVNDAGPFPHPIAAWNVASKLFAQLPGVARLPVRAQTTTKKSSDSVGG